MMIHWMLKKIRFEKRSFYAEKIISLKMFDAKGSYHKNKDRRKWGSNYWKDSNIRQWLNSS